MSRIVTLNIGASKAVLAEYAVKGKQGLTLAAYGSTELVGRNSGELGEPREHHLPVEGECKRSRLDACGFGRLSESRHENRLGRAFGIPIETGEFRGAVCGKDKPLLAFDLILGEHGAGGAYVQCYDSGHKSTCTCCGLLKHHFVVVGIDERENRLGPVKKPLATRDEQSAGLVVLG